MTAKSAFVTVLFWGVAFAGVGAAMGAALGTLAPEYYRSVFRNGHSPEFHPLQVGIGLGATQGVASGVAISIAVLFVLAWRDVRAVRPEPGRDAANTTPRSRSWTVHAIWSVVAAMSVFVAGAVTFVLGGIVGQQQLYQSWTNEKLDKLASILKSNEFADVEADYSSAAQVYLTGEVKNNAARDALHDKLVLTFGSDEADEMIWRVDVGR